VNLTVEETTLGLVDEEAGKPQTQSILDVIHPVEDILFGESSSANCCPEDGI
jgi:hypothetical protein